MPTTKSRRRGLTDRQVERLPRKAKRYWLMDPDQRGHAVRVMPVGPHVFYAVGRNAVGRQMWVQVARCGEISIAESRKRAVEIRARLAKGLPATERVIAPASFEAVAMDWLAREVRGRGMRSADEVERRLRRYALPVLGQRGFTGISRLDYLELARSLAAAHGACQADRVIADLRSLASWYTLCDANFVPPFPRRGMKQSTATPRARVLTDREIVALWNAPAEAGLYRDFARVALGTAQRRGVIAHMRWQDLDLTTALWRIPSESRAKGNGGDLVLPPLVFDVIKAQTPRLDSDSVFPKAHHGLGPVTGLSSLKAKCDALLPEIEPYATHDLRRTARSLLARSGVPREHAERILGHKIGSAVEQIYNRHQYTTEKAAGLATLAELLERILAKNVVPLSRADRQ
jgi:integrase